MRKFSGALRESAAGLGARAEIVRADASGEFEGYASLFGAEDTGRDVVLPGAFRKSLAARGPSGIRMLFQHDPNQPIGVWLAAREHARGLYVRGRLLTDVARAREVLALMRGGAIDGLSIGFKAVRARRDARTGVRRLAEIDLWEVSVVTFPMLVGARVESIRSRVLFAAARRHAPRGRPSAGSPCSPTAAQSICGAGVARQIRNAALRISAP